jgi:hypothetical protein
VVSIYLGMAGDPLAELEAERDIQTRERREALRALREQEAQLDEALGQAAEMTLAMVKAALLLAGYHPHERTWRKRRYE